MSRREEMIKKLRRQEMIDKLRASESTPKAEAAPKKDLNAIMESGMQNFQKGMESERSTMDPGESLWRGAADTASLGLADELSGGLEAAGSMVGLRGVGGEFSDIRLETDEEDQQPLGDIYSSQRDSRRETDSNAQADNPGEYLVGGVAGSLALPGGGASTLGKLGAASGLGAAYGAGSSTEESLSGIATDAVIGGTVGAATEGVLKGLGTLGKKALDGGMDAFAGKQMLQGMKPNKSVMNKINDIPGEASKVGNELLDSLGSNPFRSNSGIADALGDKLSKSGQKLEGLRASQGDKRISKKDLMVYLQKLANKKAQSGADQKQIRHVEGVIKQIRDSKQKGYDPQSINNLSNSLKNDVYGPDGMIKASTNKVNALEDSRKALNQAEVDIFDEAARPQLAAEKATYSQAKKAGKIADNADARGLTNGMFGLSSTVLAGGGLAATGDPSTGLALAGGKEFIRRYGRQLVGVTARKMAKAMRNTKIADALVKAESRGEGAVAATHFLLQQSNPEYRKIMNEED